MFFYSPIVFPFVISENPIFWYEVFCKSLRYVLRNRIPVTLCTTDSLYLHPCSACVIIISACVWSIIVSNFTHAALRCSNANHTSVCKHSTHFARLRQLPYIAVRFACLRPRVDGNKNLSILRPGVASAVVVFMALHRRLAFCMLDFSFSGKSSGKCLTKCDAVNFSAFSLAKVVI